MKAPAVPEVAGQGFVERLDEVYGTGEPYVGVGVPVSLASSSCAGEVRRYLDFVYQPIRDVNEEVTGVFVSGSDVTERVLAHEKLREEDRRKDEFLAMLAHELRNPLAPIGMTKPAELAAPERLFMDLGSGAAPAAMGSHRGATVHGAPAPCARTARPIGRMTCIIDRCRPFLLPGAESSPHRARVRSR